MKVQIIHHKFVPKHILISEKEEEEVLKKYKIIREQLPKIRKSDPVIRVLESELGEIRPGRIIKVIRKSYTAGESIGWRVVVEG
ncbi:MAG: DNA-directed RNA polymerase subunit H [Candidatus Thermoplasmatota archaeon]